MPYHVDTVRSVDKFLDKLHKAQPDDVEAIEDAIEALGDEPRPPGCTLLSGYSNVWRVRVGRYRVCYEINDRQLTVLVITISTRDDVYQLVRRYLGG